jgi:hypothetical protein
MATHKKSPTSWIKLEWFALRMPFLQNGWRKRAPTSRIGSSIMASTTTSSAHPRMRSTARPFRRFVIANIIDKVVGQSRLYRRHILRRLDRTDYLQVVEMEVGNLYLFWGYRSLHGNMPCESGALRATLLLHFGRQHGSSEALTAAVRLGQSLRSLGQKRASGSATEATAAAY